MSFWGELRRRNVFKVGAAYAIVAWVIAQIVSVIQGPLGLPDWFDTAVIVLLLIGFPLALLFAWAYELTPAGLKRTKDVPREESITASTGQKLNLILAGLVTGAVITTAVFWSLGDDGDVQWALQEAIPEIEAYVDTDDMEAAFALAQEIERRSPGLERLARLWPRFSARLSIPSDPPGARVLRRPYDSTEDDWQALGTTPIEDIRIPTGLSRLRFELPGRRSLVRTLFAFGGGGERGHDLIRDASDSGPLAGGLKPFKLDTEADLPEDKVRVAGWRENVDGNWLDFGDFFLDRHEVTNREYKRFVDAGGYQNRAYWRQPIMGGETEIPWDEAAKRFVDRTGRAGPSDWSGGDYPDGQDDYPVGGISWYEAAAYAEYMGEELPTVFHWRRAVNEWESAWVLPASNMVSTGPVPVGTRNAITWAGAHDMGGNVREWVFNELGGQRFILGGGWNDEYYIGGALTFAQPPLDRSTTNGFRLAKTFDTPATMELARLAQPIPPQRDLTKNAPVPDEVFEVYRRLHSYDSAPLNAVVEDRRETRNWIRERVLIDAAYEGERMAVYLYLPLTGSPPYQTVVYSPGLNAWMSPTIEHYGFHVDFIVRNGRAVAFPVYKGSFERRDELAFAFDRWASNVGRGRAIAIHQDMRRAIDYLETRRDLDPNAFAYYGLSMGGQFAPANLALEPRFKAAVLTVGAINPIFDFLPEIDPLNYLSRVTVPVLMLNSELDNVVPLEASAKPFFEQLGIPAADKRQVVQPGGHFVPRDVLIRETLDWLDKYLGPVKPSS